MKVAIPTEDGSGYRAAVAQHFGRAPYYALVDVSSGEVQMEPNRGEHVGGTGRPTEVILGAGVGAVLCAGLGRRAIALFRESGISVYVGAVGTVRETLAAFSDGRLHPAAEADGCPGKGEHASGKWASLAIPGPDTEGDG